LDKDLVARRRRREENMGIEVRTLEEVPKPHINSACSGFEKRLPRETKARRTHRVPYVRV
jgi:hypothetical protein